MHKLIPLLLLMVACQNSPAEADPVTEILGSSANDFREVNIGDSQTEVLAKEQEHVVYKMPEELTCRIPSALKKSTQYEITYGFGEDGLYLIELEVFPGTEKDKLELFDLFKGYYDHRYGESSLDDGFTMWQTFSHRGTDVEITMVDESKEQGRPYLSINFYEYEE